MFPSFVVEIECKVRLPDLATGRLKDRTARLSWGPAVLVKECGTVSDHQKIALNGLCWAFTTFQHFSGKGLAGMEEPILPSRADFECLWCFDFRALWSKTNFLDLCSRPFSQGRPWHAATNVAPD